jgi:hypothetical protein
VSVGWQLAFFVAGLLTGWAFPVRRRRSLSGPAVGETLDQSLARLASSFPKGSGFAPGPQPRARPGSSPAAPPHGGSGQAYSGKPILPEHTVWR